MRKKKDEVQEVKKPVGRPPEHDREATRLKMLEWVKDESQINLLAFSEHVMIAPSVVIRMSKESEAFRQTYDLVRSIIGKRREQALATGSLHVKAYDLNAQTYDQYLKAERREDSEFESKLRTKENSSIPPQDPLISDLLEEIKSLKKQINASKP